MNFLFSTAGENPSGQGEIIDLVGHEHLASAGGDGTVRIWDAVTGRQIGAPLTGHTGAVRSVVFSPDGHTLATAGDDKTMRIWDVELPHDLHGLLRAVCDIAGRSFTAEEWPRYIPGEPYRQPNCPTVR